MVDLESSEEAYGGKFAKKFTYGSAGVDINRILNATAVWSIIIFWLWTCIYWMLQYVPMPLSLSEPGSKANEYQYTNVVIDNIKVAMCPSSLHGGSVSSYCVWYFPAFICFTIVALLVRLKKFRPHKQTLLSGDMDFVLFSWVAIFIPLIIFFGFYMYKKWPTRDEGMSDAAWIADQAGTWANRVGFVGFWPLTFFMIPATRHGPLLAALGWHPYHACTIHMFCGWFSYWASMIHFLCYIIKYGAGEYPASRETAHFELTGGWKGYQFIFPPAMCFSWNGQDGGQVNFTTGEILLDDDSYNPKPPLGYSDCGKMLSGFYGTIAITFMTILVLTSMKVLRRYRYQLFYFSHIICGPFFILFVSMHWSLTYEYFWPSLFYYFATQAPYLLQHSRSTINNYGLKITGVMDIPCRQTPKPKPGDEEKVAPPPVEQSLISKIFSPAPMDWLDEQVNRVGPQAKSIEHCVGFDFAVTREGFEQFYPGMYGNIWCPDASMKSHPFSVTHVPGETDQLRIIFRVFGKWTDLLARSLIQLPCPGHQQEFLPIPKIMMDGWHGPNHLVGSTFDHDKTIIVTAGIGITAFLSMFTEMIEILCFNEDGMFIKMNDIQGVPLTKEFSLHWMCRDENLIKYITDEYFEPLMEKATRKGGDDANYQGVRCHIHIHRTGPAGQKTINPSSLWKSFRDKTERGVTEIEYGLLGTFGVPWSPYRFSFGRWDNLWQHIPSILMFCSILWCSYFFTQRVHLWLNYNAFDLPQALKYFVRITDFIPTIFISFVLGWAGHVLMDWTENVKVKKSRSEYMAKNTNKTLAYEIDDLSDDVGDGNINKSLITSGGEADTSDDTHVVAEQAVQKSVRGAGCNHDQPNMISFDSTAGRPDFDELLEIDDSDRHDSTGIYLCGPEVMIENCKKAASMGCQLAAERLQMCIGGNKFVFYEEKFEW